MSSCITPFLGPKVFSKISKISVVIIIHLGIYFFQHAITYTHCVWKWVPCMLSLSTVRDCILRSLNMSYKILQILKNNLAYWTFLPSDILNFVIHNPAGSDSVAPNCLGISPTSIWYLSFISLLRLPCIVSHCPVSLILYRNDGMY